MKLSANFRAFQNGWDILREINFKSKTYSIIGYKSSQLTVDLHTLSEEAISAMNGFGKTITKKISEIFSSGKMKILDELILKTPGGSF